MITDQQKYAINCQCENNRFNPLKYAGLSLIKNVLNVKYSPISIAERRISCEIIVPPVGMITPCME